MYRIIKKISEGYIIFIQSNLWTPFSEEINLMDVCSQEEIGQILGGN